MSQHGFPIHTVSDDISKTTQEDNKVTPSLLFADNTRAMILKSTQDHIDFMKLIYNKLAQMTDQMEMINRNFSQTKQQFENFELLIKSTHETPSKSIKTTTTTRSLLKK
jgi:predicted patatin/cPLA2 family phospholipase